MRRVTESREYNTKGKIWRVPEEKIEKRSNAWAVR